ncbi:condensin-2 complex subunit G2-like isoform X2 [Tubulanus polymorphus]|uniref:condensin-2 complex subunit G2-like isoform X2 n=1 Tax=Tubulanus polymorphus TaxID=672921 RepID=UPI003DA65A97
MTMDEQRQQFLHCTEDPDPDDFIHYIHLHLNRNEPFNAVEILQTFDRKSVEQMWNGLQNLATTMLFSFNEHEDLDDQKQQIKKASLTIEGVLILAQATIENNAHNSMPDGLYQTAIILHNMMNLLPESMDHTKDGIAKLCEQWWASEIEGREELISQTMLYLLQKGSDPKVKIVHIKRIWNVHMALGKFNFENKSFKQMKDLILRCCIPTFVKCEEGRKFLTFVFSLNLNFMDELHETIKSQLPCCPRTFLECYAKIYFNAWKAASSDSFREKVEKSCIQDLIFRAVHAMRLPAKNMALIIRTVLGCFTKQKKQVGVEEMLLRLCSPIIWRSLQVVNANVRANAASLLIEVFPLRDSDVKQNEVLLQRQLDALQNLLVDTCADVRTVAVYGVCKVCCVYWELVPAEIVKQYLTSLTQHLVYDGTSADVRVAVFRGFTHLLDNYLSHPVLKQLLPRLQDFIHDPSEKVRIAVVEMLLKIHPIRGIKVWSVVPMTHLLTRLELDSAAVIRRIVRLIFPSFVPIDKSNDTLLKRCLALLQTNPRAARVFFQYSLKHMSVKSVEKYLLVLTSCVMSCVKKELAKENPDLSQDLNDQPEDDDNDLSVDDADILCGLVESMTILYAGIVPELGKPINASSKTLLEDKFAQALPEFFRVFKDAKILSPLCLLAGFMPPNAVPLYSRSCLAKLRNFDQSATPTEYGPLLEAMCNWGKAGDVIELFTDWLKLTFTPVQKVSKKAKKKGVSFSKEAMVAKPVLGLNLLGYLLSQLLCQQRILEGNGDEMNALKNVLKDTMVHIEQYITKPTDDKNSLITPEFLQQAFDLYCKMIVLMHQQEGELNNYVIESFEYILTWVDRELLPTLEREKQSTQRKRKRTSNAAASHEAEVNKLSKNIIKVLLDICNDLLLVGLGTSDFTILLSDVIVKIAQTDVVAEFIAVLVRTLYQITEANINHDWNLATTILPNLFTEVTTAILNVTISNPDTSLEVVASVRPAFTEAMNAYFVHHRSVKSTNNDVMATIMITTMNESTYRVKSENEVIVDSLPPVTAMLVNVVKQNAYMLGLYLEEIYSYARSEALEGLKSLASLVQILQAVQKSKANASGLKDCFSAVQIRLDKIEQPKAEDAVTMEMYAVTKSMLKQCCGVVGMVN